MDGSPLRIMFLAANRIGTVRLAIEHELAAIENALRERPGEFVLDAHLDTTPDKFLDVALANPADVLHISAHAQAGRIQLQGKGSESIGFEQLGRLVELMGKRDHVPRLIILNACDTERGLADVCRHVECAIGMRSDVQEGAAYKFTTMFYTCIARGLSVADAFAVTVLRLQMSEDTRTAVPILKRRIGVDTTDIVLLPVRQPLSGRGVRVIGNRYEILPVAIARGEVASIHEALDLWSDTQTQVALKLLHPHHVNNKTIAERFLRGAEVMNMLKHRNIVRVHDVGPRSSGDPYYVMELLDQPLPLMEYTASKRLDAVGVFRLGAEIGNALEYAHNQSYIHRDVRPENVLVDRRGCPRLIRFDLVRDAAIGGSTIGPLGVPAYTAPEVLRDARAATAASDQYSLAMTLAAAIVGRAPDPKGTADTFIASISEPFASVLRKALNDRPEQRHGTMRAFCVALEETLAAPGLSSALAPAPPPRAAEQPVPSSPTASQPAQRNRTKAPSPQLLAWCAGVMTLVGSAYVIASASRTTPESTSAKPPPPLTLPNSASLVERNPTDAELDDVLRVDHSRTVVAIRITADNTLEEARGHARVVLRNSRFQPWIVRQRFGKGLFLVYVGGYSNRQTASGDLQSARAIRGEGGLIEVLPEECPRLEWTPAGYHDCAI